MAFRPLPSLGPHTDPMDRTCMPPATSLAYSMSAACALSSSSSSGGLGWCCGGYTRSPKRPTASSTATPAASASSSASRASARPTPTLGACCSREVRATLAPRAKAFLAVELRFRSAMVAAVGVACAEATVRCTDDGGGGLKVPCITPGPARGVFPCT